MDNHTALKNRIDHIWEAPNFTKIFTSIAKRPPHILKKGTVFFNEGDPLSRVYCIIDGFVKLYRLSEEGRDTTVYLLGPNNLVGVRALTSPDELARHNAEAITDIKVVTLSRKEFFDATINQPQHLADLLYVFMDRLNYTERKLEGFIFTDTTSRVANFLADCARRFGKRRGQIIELPIELTHQRIAEFVGSFRETVTNALHHLQIDGTIKTERGKITIRNLKKLNQYAASNRKK